VGARGVLNLDFTSNDDPLILFALNGKIVDNCSASISSVLFTLDFLDSLLNNVGGFAAASFFFVTFFGLRGLSFCTTERGFASCASRSLEGTLSLGEDFGFGMFDCL
jgi:hypothetical protein